MKRANRFEMFCAYGAAVVSASLFTLIGWRQARYLLRLLRMVHHVLFS